jgi:hypothetical protein
VLYAMVGRLLTRGKHLHGRIISLRREISAHIASFNPTTFCWSDSINQGSERSFICMPGMLSLSGHSFVCQGCWVWAVIHLYARSVEFACFDDFVFGVWNCYDIVVILVFHFIIENEGFSPFFIPETRREH